MLTVYGIETHQMAEKVFVRSWLQQCLPFTVLKRFIAVFITTNKLSVATVLTVYGIETIGFDQ